jgi:hypothetical protein
VQIAAIDYFGWRSSVISQKLINWILCWILLPNVAFILIWIVGAPPRYPEIIATGVIGLIVRKASFSIRLTGFVVALAYSVLSFVAALFNLAIASLIESLQFMAELRPAAAPEYLVLAVLLGATLVSAWKLLKRPTDFELAWEIICAAALLCSFAGLDWWLSYGNRGSYKRSAPNGAAFSSAAEQTGLSRLAGDRNLLIVVVESMGLPKDTELRSKLLKRWRQSDIGRLYDVEIGSTAYYGSTTSAEVRELCGRWGDYQELAKSVDRRCLPARLAAKGYQTTAIHSFEGSFFDRARWYPNTGFQSMLFRDELVGSGAAKCPGVFPGACDRDVPAIIAQKLKRTDRKQFIYWLSVNSHLPVPSDAALRTNRCDRFDRALAENYAMACRLFSLWSELNDGLATLLTDPDLPATDVLIVGDHAPPFFDRQERSLFDPKRVPWVLLKRRGGDSPMLQRTRASRITVNSTG